MNDRELLELAAKASGIALDADIVCGTYGEGTRDWNPLDDDGDALRLAVRLGLCILIESGHVVCTRYYAEPQKLTPHGERLGEDASQSTRRAIVRAAAEVGKGMLTHDEFVAMFPGRFPDAEVQS